jgi:hypothetical protein
LGCCYLNWDNINPNRYPGRYPRHRANGGARFPPSSWMATTCQFSRGGQRRRKRPKNRKTYGQRAGTTCSRLTIPRAHVAPCVRGPWTAAIQTANACTCGQLVRGCATCLGSRYCVRLSGRTRASRGDRSGSTISTMERCMKSWPAEPTGPAPTLSLGSMRV